MNTLTDTFSIVTAQSERISLLIVAWLALRVLLRGRLSPQILFVGWLVIMLGLLVPISLPVAWSPFNWLRPPASFSAVQLSGSQSSPVTSIAVTAPTVVVPVRSAVRGSIAHFWTLRKIAAAVWLAGLLGLLSVRLAAWISFYRGLRRRPAPAGPRLAALVEECAEGLNIKRAVSVQTADAAGGPAVGGLWRPVIFLPRRLEETLTAEQQRLVILHELGHWRRGDLLANLLDQAALVLHWFNPFVWIAARMTRTDCELACDEFVLRRISAGGTEQYGITLLKVLTAASGQPSSSAVLGILTNKQLLKRRIQMIADYRTWTFRRALAGWALIVLLAAAIVTREMRAQSASASTTPVPPALSAPSTMPAPAVAPAPGKAPTASGNGYYSDSWKHYRHGQQLAKDGKYADALAEYLWCYDDGMRRDAPMSGVRDTGLLDDIAKLGKNYPPALQALRDHLANAKAWLKDHPNDYAATSDFAALNHELGDDAATLAYYDQLPVDSLARKSIGYRVFPLLLEAKQYSDALAANPYDQFMDMVDRRLRLSQRPPFLQHKESMIKDLLDSGARELEALAGAGKLDDARDLIKRLLAIDPSGATRTLLRAHLERAGHPELLDEAKSIPAN